ncbi:MAG: cryptochrome/photolyase family protein [Pannonibacter phragmitetus]
MPSQPRDRTTIVWFRQDLRLADNPALFEAAKAGAVVPVFILEEPKDCGETHPMGGASRWWLHHALAALDESLAESLGGRLVLMRGPAGKALDALVKETGASAVHWNRCYEPHAIARDKRLKADLMAAGVEVRSFNGSLLHEPWELETKTGGPFKVYSPFWRAALAKAVPAPLPVPEVLDIPQVSLSLPLSDFALLPVKPDWAAGWLDLWQPGERGAAARLTAFLAEGLDGYGELRNRPDLPNVSRLSPHLHFGEISPRQIWTATRFHTEQHGHLQKDGDKFLSEIGWREFSYHLLYHFPHLPERNWKPAFDAYPWAEDDEALKAWQKGLTGYPMVDAGMRELWATGYMHNRVRMLVASFLVKHLRLHWHHGEEWFRDTLLDADLANNSASWQWVTGSGADAAPYFRIFNPVGQGQKFDPDGAYVRRWCPELAKLPDEFLHCPHEAPERILKAAGVILGRTYPRPIVDHTAARNAALAGYDAVKQAGLEAAG